MANSGSSKINPYRAIGNTALWRSFKSSPAWCYLKRYLKFLMPGWPDEGRIISQGPKIAGMIKLAKENIFQEIRILNAGAGEGLYSELLLRTLPVKQLIDIDVNYHSAVRKKLNHNHQHVSASLTSLPLSDQCVDFILCSEVLEHIQNDREALKELTRVLVPGGYLLVSVPSPPAVFDPDHVREGYTRSELENMMRAQGFLILSTTTCMFVFFKTMMRIWRHLNWMPKGCIVALANLDRWVRLGNPMDLILLGQLNPDHQTAETICSV